jgi:hypothetical protein
MSPCIRRDGEHGCDVAYPIFPVFWRASKIGQSTVVKKKRKRKKRAIKVTWYNQKVSREVNGELKPDARGREDNRSRCGQGWGGVQHPNRIHHCISHLISGSIFLQTF